MSKPKAPPLQIVALNTGYKDGESDHNYDFIQLARGTSDPLDMTGFKISYTNSLGHPAGEILLDNYILKGPNLFLAYAESPQFKDFNLDFLYNFGSSGLASTGGMLQLSYGGEILNEICWGKVKCADSYPAFSTDPELNTSLVRCTGADCERSFVPIKYYPFEEAFSTGDFVDMVTTPGACQDLLITEFFSNYKEDASEQFVELFNAGTQKINLINCRLRYKGKNVRLSGELEAAQYKALYNWGFNLNKIPASDAPLELVDYAGRIVDQARHTKEQPTDTSYALFSSMNGGHSTWQHTYHPTPGAANIYQEFRSCEGDKIIDPRTGRCVERHIEDPDAKPSCPAGQVISEITGKCHDAIVNPSLKPCPEGQYRHPETHRCRKIDTGEELESKPEDSASDSDSRPDPRPSEPQYKPCPEGQYRHPETHRCRKIESEPVYQPCPEGQYRHPETHRCRKIVADTPNASGSSSGGAGGSGSGGSSSSSEDKKPAYKPCPEGQYRHPETHRCRKIESEQGKEELKPCKEGYERNPETNRCRKKAPNSGDEFPIKPEPDQPEQQHPDRDNSLIYWVIGGLAFSSVVIAVYQFRNEIVAGIIKLWHIRKKS